MAYYKYKGPLSFVPCTSEKISLLSSEAPQQNYRGLMNLMIIMLISSNARNMYDNYKKYGWLLNVSFKISSMNL